MNKNQQRMRFPRRLIILWLGIIAMGAASDAPGLAILFFAALLYVIFMDQINGALAGRMGKGHQVSEIEYAAYVSAIDGYRDTPTAYIAAQTELPEKRVIQDLMFLTDRRHFAGAFFDDAGNFIVPGNTKVRDVVPKVKKEDRIKCPYCEHLIPTGLNYCYACGKDLSVIREVEEQRTTSIAEMRGVADTLTENSVKETVLHICDLTDQIFKKYEEEPHLLKNASQFREYYLPKTIAAMEYYQKLDQRDELSEREEDLRAQIEDSLMSIEEAFTNLLRRLSSSGSDDLSADVSALEAVLKQDGLATPDFETIE